MTETRDESPRLADEPDQGLHGVLPPSWEAAARRWHRPRIDRRSAVLAALLAMVAWLATAIYKVQPEEQGIILRFGKWVDTTPPGLHVHWPWPIETVLLPKITQINQMQLGDAAAAGAGEGGAGRDRQMLTGDENIVEADCAVFWKIADAGQYLFGVEDPEAAVRIAAEGALREVIGRTPIQAAMSEKRQQIADKTRALLQTLLDAEHAGILVTQVQLQRADPPAAVIDAFNDVQRARADQERARNEAEAYSNDILPRARGEAEHIRQEAEAYKTQVVNLAQGEANAFLSVYRSYAGAKEVTAWRLYLESVDEVLRKSTKVIVDSSGRAVSGVVPYLPVSEFRPRPPPQPAPGPGPSGAGR
jgi:modulator of FtsH protease HflK